MLRGEGGAEGGNGVLNAVLMQGQQVEIALDHENGFAFAASLPGPGRSRRATGPWCKSGFRVSSRYLGRASSSTRPPKPITWRAALRIGKMIRSGNGRSSRCRFCGGSPARPFPTVAGVHGRPPNGGSAGPSPRARSPVRTDRRSPPQCRFSRYARALRPAAGCFRTPL